MENELELIDRARGGDKAALRALIDRTKDLVFNLALRMLGNPADAEDASQEILIRVITGLATFRGDSAFKTWVYRVASNHLLNAKKRKTEEVMGDFDLLSKVIAEGVADDDPPIEDRLLAKEAMLTCTSYMLLGLDRDHRLAFILGEILELSAEEGAAVLELSIDAFRKRLSRARRRMADFSSATCGITDPANPCRCEKQMARRIRLGLFDPTSRSFTVLPTQPEPSDREAHVEAVEGLGRALAVLRSHPAYAAPEAVAGELRRIIDSGRSELFS